MGDGVEGFSKIEVNHIHASIFVVRCSPVRKTFKELSDTGTALLETMLFTGDELLFFGEFHQLVADYFLEKFDDLAC